MREFYHSNDGVQWHVPFAGCFLMILSHQRGCREVTSKFCSENPGTVPITSPKLPLDTAFYVIK